MTWEQTLWYFLNKRNTFSIDIGRDRFSVQAHRPNAYNAALRRISNLPFPGARETSPKFARILEALLAGRQLGLKQLVYSSRRDTGANALVEEWVKRTNEPKKAFLIDGSMAADARTRAVAQFNKKLAGAPAVMFVTDAACQGVDLKGVGQVHLVEPSESLMHENQVVNRAIRFRSHEDGSDAVVRVLLYVSTFPPATASVDVPRFKQVLDDSGVLHGEAVPLKSVVRALQEQHVQRDADGQTIDELTLTRREEEGKKIAQGLELIRRMSIEAGGKHASAN